MKSDGRHEVRTMHVYICDLDGQYYHLTSADAGKVEQIRDMTAKRMKWRNWQ